jgi:putative transposase
MQMGTGVVARLDRTVAPADQGYEASEAVVTLATIRPMLHRLVHPNRRRLPAP